MNHKTATAYHEAGHAVIAWRLGMLGKRGASIVPDVDSHGRVHTRRGRGEDGTVSSSNVALKVSGAFGTFSTVPLSVTTGHDGIWGLPTCGVPPSAVLVQISVDALTQCAASSTSNVNKTFFTNSPFAIIASQLCPCCELISELPR